MYLDSTIYRLLLLSCFWIVPSLAQVWVESPDMAVRVNPQGVIDSIRFADGTLLRGVRAQTMVGDCHRDKPADLTPGSNGGVESLSSLSCPGRRTLKLRERFFPTATSIRWETEISGNGKPWSAPIRTLLHYPDADQMQFWTAWSDPDRKEDREWRDPLTARPLREAVWHYGAPAYAHRDPHVSFIPFGGDLISIPIASLLDPARDRGLSLVLSPAERILNVDLKTSATGDVEFIRTHYRLAGPAPVRFTSDLTPHEAGWRGGLRWMSQRYSQYFDPVNPLAHQLSGTAAYSTSEEPLDVAKYRRMAFRTNWKASFDFPYMGMFLPPVTRGEPWARFSYHSPERYSPEGEAPNGRTSIDQLAAYSERMRKQGFHCLNYFNVTEFGAHMVYPAPPRVTSRAKFAWKDANDYFYEHLADAALYVADDIPLETLKPALGSKPGQPYVSWGDSFVMDCAEPSYKAFLLRQARRHIEELPASSGICIDRLDWLRMYNERRDDGISWVEGRPVRSLYVSWDELMKELGPLFHQANKVIFCNNHDKRLDLLKDIDGIYDEFGYAGAPLNLTAWLAIRKPAMAWTATEKDLLPDPDAFFQRYLHMGVFPTAPIPGNDHAIVPSEWADRQYLDYGPLLDCMRERKWVLDPHPIEGSDGVEVNLFEVPDGYAIPVTQGTGRKAATVTMRRLRMGKFRAYALHPGVEAEVELTPVRQGDEIKLSVPLIRGCAMVHLQYEGDQAVVASQQPNVISH